MTVLGAHERLLDAIAAIYDAALDASAWNQALERCSNDLNGGSTSIVFQSRASQQPEFHCVRRPIGSQAKYLAHFIHQDPTQRFVLRAPPGIYTDRMILPKSDLVRTEFYNDFARPLDMHNCLKAVVFADQSGSGRIAVTCSERAGDFDEGHLQFVRTLLPHLARAMRVQLRLRAAEVAADSATEALDRVPQAVFLVDARARIVFANRAAEAMLARADGICLDAGGLAADRSSATAALRRLVARAATSAADSPVGGSLLLERRSGRRPLLALVTPLQQRARPAWVPMAQPAAMLLVTDPESSETAPDLDRLRALYGLTASEAALAGKIARGGGVKQAARALGIAPSTARTHLHRVFAKTGTGRQAELAALLASLPQVVGA